MFTPKNQPFTRSTKSETYIKAVTYKKADALSSSSPAKTHKVLVPSDNYFRH